MELQMNGLIYLIGLIVVIMFILINLIVDVLYSVLDPRVRLQDMKG
jgi:peptide/nickel transport system permease protein